MRRHVVASAVVAVSIFSLSCGGPASPAGDSAGASGSLSGGSSPGGSPAASGSAGASSGGAPTAGSAGASQTTDGGGAGAGGKASAGASGSTSQPGGAAGDASDGGSGGLNQDGPCAVPSYIDDEPLPIGWASEGSGTSGGGTVAPILVTSLDQLKSEVSGTSAKVIYVQGELAADKIKIGSNKTIVGCSPGAKLRGHVGIGSGSANVIIRNLAIIGYGVGDCSKDPDFDSATGCSSGNDAVSVNGSAHHVWLDHCLIMDGTDGNLDITNDADFVTVSFTKFTYTPRTDNVGDDSTGASGHRYSNLVGGSDTEPSGFPSTRPLNVTWHHDWWADGVVERQPRVRFGRNHVFNSYYSSSESNYCVRAGIDASILLEGNYFDGVRSPHQFNSSSNQQTAYIDVGEDARANSYVSTSGDEATEGGGSPFTPPYSYQVEAASGVPAVVKAQAGPH